jgi:hypothetical protein
MRRTDFAGPRLNFHGLQRFAGVLKSATTEPIWRAYASRDKVRLYRIQSVASALCLILLQFLDDLTVLTA